MIGLERQGWSMMKSGRLLFGVGSIPGVGLKRELFSSLLLNGEYRINWILMAVGLVLMVGPWIYYFYKRNNSDDQD